MSGRSSRRAMKGTCYQYKGLDKDDVDDLTSPFDGTVQVQNVKAARVYVFGDADIEEEEVLNDDAEEHELRVRGRSRDTCGKEEGFSTLERPILKGETLQKIAVKYCCDIAELKRINNLLKDQDFFALTSIKVPVAKYGLAREVLEEEIRQNADTLGISKTNGSAMSLGVNDDTGSVLELLEDRCSDEEDPRDIDGEEDRQRLLVHTVSIRNSLHSQSTEARDFLRRMDTDIKSILASTKSSRKRNLEEVRSSLMCRRIYPMNRKEGFLSADCGMKFSTIITIIIIVAIVTPLMYLLYYKYILPNRKHENNS